MRSSRLSVVCSTLALVAIAPALRAASFERFHGDEAHVEGGGWSTVARVCRSGGFLTTGTTTTSQFAIQAVRTAANGAVLWDKAYTLGPGISGGAAVELRDGSGFVIAGEVINSFNEADLLLVKIDCAGAPVWANSYPGPAGFFNGVNRVIEAANGDLVVAGFSQDNTAQSLAALLLRTDATGALLWSRKYDGDSPFTNFEGIVEARGSANDQDDLVVVGYHSGPIGPARPFVVRIGSKGKTPVRCGVEYQPETFAIFSSVAQLTSPGHAGEFVIAGRAEQSGVLLLRTGADVCQPVAERLIQGPVTGPVALAELPATLKGAPQGTLAVAGTIRANPAPDEGYLLTVSPATLEPLTGHLLGDHAPANINSRFALVQSVLALPDGFAVTGDTTIGPIFGDDQDLYITKTDAQGQTPCDEDLTLAHQAVTLPTSPIKLTAVRSELGSLAHTDIVATDLDAHRNACGE